MKEQQWRAGLLLQLLDDAVIYFIRNSRTGEITECFLSGWGLTNMGGYFLAE